MGEKIPLHAAYVFAAAHGLESEATAIRKMKIEWNRYNSSLRAAYLAELFEKHGVFEEFKKEHWPFGNTAAGQAKRRFYAGIIDDYKAFLSKNDPVVDGDDGPDESSSAEEALEFALESHLRDFLAKNLERIEPGLQLYAAAERKGVEFPVESGRIDLLAVDRNGTFVVIELKLSQGRNKTLGQLLYYMSWVDRNLGNGPCRRLIIASDISAELSMAAVRVPGVSLSRYRMSFTIEPASA